MMLPYRYCSSKVPHIPVSMSPIILVEVIVPATDGDVYVSTGQYTVPGTGIPVVQLGLVGQPNDDPEPLKDFAGRGQTSLSIERQNAFGNGRDWMIRQRVPGWYRYFDLLVYHHC